MASDRVWLCRFGGRSNNAPTAPLTRIHFIPLDGEIELNFEMAKPICEFENSLENERPIPIWSLVIRSAFYCVVCIRHCNHSHARTHDARQSRILSRADRICLFTHGMAHFASFRYLSIRGVAIKLWQCPPNGTSHSTLFQFFFWLSPTVCYSFPLSASAQRIFDICISCGDKIVFFEFLNSKVASRQSPAASFARQMSGLAIARKFSICDAIALNKYIFIFGGRWSCGGIWRVQRSPQQRAIFRRSQIYFRIGKA